MYMDFIIFFLLTPFLYEEILQACIIIYDTLTGTCMLSFLIVIIITINISIVINPYDVMSVSRASC